MPTWLITLWTYRKWVAIALAVGALYFAGYETRVKLDEADTAARLVAEQKAQKAAQDATDAAAEAWEKKLADLAAENRQLKGKVTNEVKAPVYHSCVVPVTGVQLYNSALTGNSAR